MILIILLIQLIQTQINITSYTNYPQYYNPSVHMFESNLANNGNQILLSLLQGGKPKIIKLDVSDPSNVHKMGEYVWMGQFGVNQGTVFYITHLYQDYLIACSQTQQKCKVWNLTSFVPVGLFNQNLYLSTSQLIQSKGIYIFGSNTGNLVYVNLSTFPNPIYHYVHNESSTARIRKSPDQVYLAVTYEAVAKLRIYNLSDWSLVKTLNLVNSNSQAIWSFNNRYLIVFSFNLNYLIVYDRDSNWQIVNNVSIGYNRVRTCRPYQQTNSYLCLGGTNLAMFSLNLYDFSVRFVLDGFQGSIFKASQNNKIFVIYQNKNVPALFYQFNRYCNQNTFYHISQKSCVVCDQNCVQCLSTTTCKECQVNYTLINGICQICGLNELYNQTTKLCDDVTDFCSGDHYFSIPLLICVQCQPNCAKCSSTFSCQQCSQNFVLLNGSCQVCGQNQLFNSTTKLCDKMTDFCSEYQYFNISLLTCVSCQPYCERCASTNLCSICLQDYLLINGICFPESQVNEKSIIIQLLQSSFLRIINKIPGNRILLVNFFLTSSILITCGCTFIINESTVIS